MEAATLIRGRTSNSTNFLHNGFRYSKDSKETQDGRQAWRCVLKNQRCRGRLYTEHPLTLPPHTHDPDFSECEAKHIYSEAKDMYVSFLIHHSKILKTAKKNATQDAIPRLPEKTSFKRALKYKENPVPPAFTTLDDIVLDPTEIVPWGAYATTRQQQPTPSHHAWDAEEMMFEHFNLINPQTL